MITVYNVVLPPGNNTRDFDGTIYLDVIGSNLGPILASQAKALAKGMIEITASGNSTIVNGEHIKFVEQVLNSKRVSSSISVVTLLSDVLSGFIGGGSNSSANIVDVLGAVLGNSTFIQEVAGHWNTTSITATGTSSAALKSKRVKARGAELAWNMLKLGMKIDLAKR